MKLEYQARLMEYAEDGSRLRLKVLLGNSEGAVYPVYLPVAMDSLSNPDLLEQALEVVYQCNFPMKAENERFAEHGRLLAEAKAEIAQVKEKALAEIQAEIEKNREMVRIVTMTMNEVLARFEEAEEDETLEPTEE